MRDPIEEFRACNRPFALRNPELFRMKIARMAESPFAFFRGTFHLFARDVLAGFSGPIPLLSGEGVEMALVGDIHSENYGTYKAGDGQIYYDVNDFDETTHGRLDLDVCRLATSLFLVARERNHTLGEAVQVTLRGVAAYADLLPRLLKKGKEYIVNETALCGCSAIDDLVTRAAAAKRPEFIKGLTTAGPTGRTLLRTAHYFNLPDAEREQAVRLLQDYVTRMPSPPTANYYHVNDVCGRVSGIGSMGRLRYVVLINGKGSSEARNVLLEFKEARPSAYDLFRQRQTDDGALVRRAEAVISQQRECQAASSKFLGYAVDGGLSFQVRPLGPPEARLDLKALKNVTALEKVAAVQASILARIHARSAGRAVGPTNPLADLSDPELFGQRVLAFALAYADQVKQDWVRFVGHRAELERWRGE